MVEDSGTQDKKISVTVSSHLLQHIDYVAAQAGKARSEYVRDAIETHVVRGQKARNPEKFSVALSSALLSELDMYVDLVGGSRSELVRNLLSAKISKEYPDLDMLLDTN
ncbi:MAG: hypothetical protein ACJZ59_04095 [Candidatus Thalassarchaeaceae archaeon]